MSTKDKKDKTEEKEIDGLKVLSSVELPASGKTAIILEGKGKHSQIAAKAAGGDPEQYLPALMHILVRVDGQKVAIEDFSEWPLRDYNALSTEFNTLYFL